MPFCWHKNVNYTKIWLQAQKNRKIKTKVANVASSKHFYRLPLQHLQIEDGTIDDIFKTYLVRSDEVATIKSEKPEK